MIAGLREPPTKSAAPAEMLESVTLECLRRVLRRPDATLDSDFFDLGGDSVVALQLMLDLERQTGRELPLTVIYDAPTARQLTDILAEGDTPTSSCLVRLKDGYVGPPLFIAHGLGGSVMELAAVARAMETGCAVYGIQAIGLDGAAQPLDRIESMAAEYLTAIRRIQPHGPYRLGGFSFGGLVAFEMARRLLAEQEQIGLLVMLDTFPHTRYWPLRARMAAWRDLLGHAGAGATLVRLAAYYREQLRGKDPLAATRYLLGRGRRGAAMAFDIFRLGAWLERFAGFAPIGPSGRGRVELPAHVERVQRAGERAYAAYRPGRFDGRLVFVKADGERRVPFDAMALLRPRTRSVVVRSIPTDHQNLVRQGATALAAELDALLREGA